MDMNFQSALETTNSWYLGPAKFAFIFIAFTCHSAPGKGNEKGHIRAVRICISAIRKQWVCSLSQFAKPMFFPFRS